MATEIKKIKDIKYREDLYPRFKLDVKLVQKYKECLDQLPPIDINQNNILIDGYHRLTAFRSEEREGIPVNIIETKSEKEILKEAIRKNAKHGFQLKSDEKKTHAINFIEEMSIEELAKMLSVDERTIGRWTKNKREDLKKQRDKKILELYLRAWNTQEMIAKEVGCVQSTVLEVIKNFIEKGQMPEIDKTFKPQIYSEWNYHKADNQVKYPRNVPQDIVEQLLYYYTEPFDVVTDSFGGRGITIDACQKWFRRYYVSDIAILPEREGDIKEWDIRQGFPKDCPPANLIFLDPPYYKKKEKDYQKDSISSFPREKYLLFFQELFKNCYERLKDNGIMAFLMSSYVDYDDPKKSVNIVDYQKLISSKFILLYEIGCPLSSEQYKGFQVDKAKKEKRILMISRNLLIYKKEKI